MRKFFLLLLTGALFTACIDKDYDLENIETDNVTIGGDESKFEIPLAKVLVTLADIANGDVNIQELCEKADKWLPSNLPGNADYVDLTQLTLHSYTDGIFDALIAEMQSTPSKLDEVTDMIWDDYRDVFASILGVSPSPENEALFKTAFKTVYDTDDRVLGEVKSQFSGYLTEDLNVEPIDYNIGRVDISDDVVDMIADNLDPEGSGSSKNSLYLAGEIASKLPLSLYLEPELKSVPEDGSPATTILKFDVEVDATKGTNEIKDSEKTRLYAEGLRQLLNNAAISIPVTLEKYYPGKGFETGKSQIEIKLYLIKNGGLKLDI
ncbi:hypothetical protein [Alistipes sp.]|uniref:hypothetical protein n=1 Tax=Alistipes sp. TaxID=1872444 RepID=UPI003AB43B81